MTALLGIYQALTGAAKPLLRFWLRLRLARGKEDADRLPERMGLSAYPRPAGPLVWLHAASVGEAQSALILVTALLAAKPDVNILVTSGTVTSAYLMAQRLPPRAFHHYVPLDQPDWVAAFLNHWRPDMGLWMESELWPNLLTAIKARNIPAILVNGRLSDRSFRRWSMVQATAKTLLDTFPLILTQTDADAMRFQSLGAGHVLTTGNVKYSAEPLPHDPLALSALKLAVGDRPVWIYASSHAGEESLACRVHKIIKETYPNLLTIIAPRHPERREEIAGICFAQNLKYRLRGPHAALPVNDDDIYIADTLGELGLFYTLCPVAMIGRSFSDDGGGGHNPIEAAQLGCAVMTGPHNQYQQAIYDDMHDAGAVFIARSEERLIAHLHELLGNPDALNTAQSHAAAFAAARTGVIDTVMANLAPFLSALDKDAGHAA